MVTGAGAFSRTREAAARRLVVAVAVLVLLDVAGGLTAIADAVLALACLVSAASGFFDGGLGAPGLSRRHVALQVLLVSWTALTGLVAADLVRRPAPLRIEE
jgi:hypothetical protein